MHFSQSLTHLGLALLAFTELCSATPIQRSGKQHRLNSPHSPVKHTKNPYTPGAEDKFDHKIDAVGKNLHPLPWRNGDGASVMGPQNPARQQQNPDLVRPPSTDHGSLNNMRWSFADSHIRIEEGGWTRQTTVRELPTSKELAGVNMRLDYGVIRELHWHTQAEWAYVLEGNARVTALDPEGGNFIGDIEKGDLWYFPAGFPHSIQGLHPEGTEFLLIFDDGNFSEESTFILTDWLAHTSKSVLGENFHLSPEVFSTLPKSEKYIFQGQDPGTLSDAQPLPGAGVKKSKYQFTHKMLAQEPLNATGGQVRITDSRNFPISKTVAAAHLDIQPGALREMHWHPNADEWSFFIRGRARVTIFGAQGTARTFDYTAGDVGIVPKNMGHFIEAIGPEPLEVLEIFRASEFQDFSLFEWLGQTPQRNVRDHLFRDDPEGAAKFAEAIEGAEKDVIKKEVGEGRGYGSGLQSVLGR